MTPEDELFRYASLAGRVAAVLSILGFILALTVAPSAINMGIGCGIVAACILGPLHWPIKEDKHE